MESLDDASLRRFDLKIRFDYLRPKQAWPLFRQTLADHGRKSPVKGQWQQRLQRLDRLTPGDFQTVLRARRLDANPLTPEGLLQGLEQECALKDQRHGRGIGFSAVL
jgi:transitional endoplasmic reticulum ATPase